MGKKDEIRALDFEIQKLKKRLAQSQKENKSLEKKVQSLEIESDMSDKDSSTALNDKSKQIALLKRKLVKVRKEADDIMIAKNKEITRLKKDIKSSEYVLKASTEDITLPPGSVLDGGIKTPKNIVIGAGSEINGRLKAGDSVTVGESSNIQGQIFSASNIALASKVDVKGSVEAKGEIAIGDFAAAHDVLADGKVSIGKNTRVKTIVSGGPIEIGDGARVNGNVTYHSAVQIGKGVVIKGSLTFKQEDDGKEKIEDISDLKKLICPICGSVNRPRTTSCTTCGEQFSAPEKADDEEGEQANGLSFRLPKKS